MSYEVQANKNGKWVIESVQPDEDAAVYDAQLLLRNKSTMSVRVVQEIYNPNDDSYRTKVVFRRARTVAEADSVEDEDEEEKRKKKKGHGAKLEQDSTLWEDVKYNVKEVVDTVHGWITAFVGSIYYQVFKLALIVGIGIYLLVTLKDLATKL